MLLGTITPSLVVSSPIAQCLVSLVVVTRLTSPLPQWRLFPLQVAVASVAAAATAAVASVAVAGLDTPMPVVQTHQSCMQCALSYSIRKIWLELELRPISRKPHGGY